MDSTIDGGYTGNLHIKCFHCGSIATFHIKTPIAVFSCHECRCKTALEKLKKVHLNCECGNHATYFTNLPEEPFDIDCFACGQPVAMIPLKKSKAPLYEGGPKRTYIGFWPMWQQEELEERRIEKSKKGKRRK